MRKLAQATSESEEIKEVPSPKEDFKSVTLDKGDIQEDKKDNQIQNNEEKEVDQ